MQKIDLWEGEIPFFDAKAQEGSENEGTPTMELYLLDAQEAVMDGIVLCCPGGAYGFRAEHEGKGMAQYLNSRGFHAAVLNYRVAPYRYPAALCDAARALRTLRYHAKEWGIAPDKIAIMGSSAGGHLAASLAACHIEAPCGEDEIDRLSARPDLAVLCYPVITSGIHTHGGSIENLLGTAPSEKEMARVSIETRVTADMPPVFLWHTYDDEAVPVENSLLLANALRTHQIPLTMHIYEHGHHGLGLAQGTQCESWSGLMTDWLKKHWCKQPDGGIIE